MKLRPLVTVLGLAAIIGCATASIYTGPVAARPTLTITYMRHLVPSDDPRWPPHLETLATANVTNPSNADMDLALDCTESYTRLNVKARTTEHVLLDPGDKECTVK